MIPLSFGQQRLWFLDRVEKAGRAYNVLLHVQLRGDLDSPALAASLGDLVRRHDVLRTVYPERDGAPFPQILSADLRLNLLTKVDGRSTELILNEIIQYEFDLAKEIPLRAFLQPVSSRHHIMYLLIHHIAVDGWSIEPMLRDIGRAYAARRESRLPDWKALPVQYVDFAQWQRNLLGSPDDPMSLMTEQLNYWRDALIDLPAEISLPADRPHPVFPPGFDGGAVPFAIDSQLHRGLLNLARETRTTLFMVMQAVVAALFSRLGAGADIPIGTAVAGRADEALNELVGFFVNTIVLRNDVSGDPTFRELLARVRTNTLAAFDHQDVPFEKVVEVLMPARTAGRHPLFQTMLTIQSDYVMTPEFPGLDVRTGRIELIERQLAKFDLYFDMSEAWDDDGAPAGMSGELKYATARWDYASAEIMTQRLLRMVSAMLADPDTLVSETDILSEQERERYRLEDVYKIPLELTVAQHFEHRATANPSSVALIAHGRPYTYEQLDFKANGLAHHLLNLGVSQGSLVGIELTSEPDLVVAQLAVWKIGAAWTIDTSIAPLGALIGAKVPQAAAKIIIDVHVVVDSYSATGPAVSVSSLDVACLLASGNREGELLSHRTLVSRALHTAVDQLFDSTQWWTEMLGHSFLSAERSRAYVGGYVLDDRLDLVVPGVQGTLYLPGDLAGYGWHGEQARTATAIVADPHGPPGARMLCTGRVARECSDGTVELLLHGSSDTRRPGAAARSIPSAARTPRQEILCGIFAEALGLQSVGLREDFFELGGQSLLAARVAGRIRSSFRLELDLSTVFRAPTVARLDALLGRLDQAWAEPRPAARRPDRLPLSPSQLRLWMLDQIHGPSASYNIPIALRLRGLVDVKALQMALNDVVSWHEALRTVLLYDGEPYQYVHPSEQAHIAVDRMACSESDLADVLSALFERPFELASGPLIRAHLVSTGEDQQVLLLVVHHTVCDGASQKPLLHDLCTAYEARSIDEVPVRHVGSLQYADYSLWQQEILGEADEHGSVLDRQLEHWQTTLARLPEEVTLKPDRGRTGEADMRSETVEVSLDAALHDELVRLSRATGTTLFMTLHAGFAAALKSRGVGEDIPIGTAIAGRGHEAFDHVVGFFTNTVVLRTDLSGDPSFTELLERLRTIDLDAFGHQDVPFDQVVQRINPRRSSRLNPLFQIGLALEHHEVPAFAPKGLHVTREPMHGVVAKLDLDFTLTEHRTDRGASAGITGTLEYPAAIYDRPTIEDVIAVFVQLLKIFTEDPGKRLSVAQDAVS